MTGGILMRKSTKWLARSVVLSLALALPAVAAAEAVPSGTRLKDLVSSTDIGARTILGTAAPQTSVLQREFNSIQPTWYTNWGGWTGPYSYDLNSFNEWVNWGETNNKKQYMHMLVGGNTYLPDWFKNGSWTNAEMDNMMKEMIRNVIQSNGNGTKVEVWNVTNEAFAGTGDNPLGSYLTDEWSKWNQLGYEADASGLSGTDKINNQHPVYIRKAYEYARQYTNAKLEIRDYGFEFNQNNARGKGFYQLVRHLLAKGTPLDAVGLQFHLSDLDNTYNWSNMKNTIQQYKALGLEVYVTELDIAEGTTWDSTQAEKQKNIYKMVMKTAMEAGADAIFTWGLADGADTGWRTYEHPLPFDENHNAKPAYYGIQEALNETNSFHIKAKGSAGGEKLELRVDNVTVASWYLSKEWTDYSYTGYSGTHNVKIAFVNDGSMNGVDMNPQIDYLKVNGNEYQAESGFVNTGNNGASEWMYWNGHIDFGSITK